MGYHRNLKIFIQSLSPFHFLPSFLSLSRLTAFFLALSLSLPLSPRRLLPRTLFLPPSLPSSPSSSHSLNLPLTFHTLFLPPSHLSYSLSLPLGYQWWCKDSGVPQDQRRPSWRAPTNTSRNRSGASEGTVRHFTLPLSLLMSPL